MFVEHSVLYIVVKFKIFFADLLCRGAALQQPKHFVNFVRSEIGKVEFADDRFYILVLTFLPEAALLLHPKSN